MAPQAHPWATSTTAKTETEVSGTIQQVTAKHGATQVVIEGSKGTVTADLGPYASNTAKSLSAGDHIEIAGWTRSSNGNEVLIARQITAGERQIVIRNDGFEDVAVDVIIPCIVIQMIQCRHYMCH